MFWLGAIVSLCYIPGVTGMFIATQWPVLSGVLAFVLFISALAKLYPELAAALPAGCVRNGRFTPIHAVGLAFVLYACVRLPFSPIPYGSMFGLWQIIIMGAAVWFGTTLTSTRELYAGLAVGAAVSSAVAVVQYFGFHPVETMTTSTPAGLYVNSVQQGAVLALIAVALASERMWLWVLPLVPGIVLCQSRGAWVILAVGLLACYVRRLWVFGAFGAAAVMAYFTLFSMSDVERMYIWRHTWQNLIWFGWGPGVFYNILLPFDADRQFFPEYAHNDALQLAFEYGLGALLAAVVFGYALYRTDVKEWPVIVAFVAAGCFSMPLFMPIASFLALVAVGRVLRVYGVVVSDGGYSRPHVVPRGWSCARTGRQTVSVASHFAAKG